MTPRARRPTAAIAAGFAVLAAALVLYLLTLDDGLRLAELQGGDLITHQYAQVQGRFSNAPGYPLYTMLGWAWFRAGGLLLGGLLTPMQILSLYSALWALPALALLYLLALQVSDGYWPVAAAVTAFYAVTYFFWYYAVSTEQYTSAVFQTLLLIWLAWRWDRTGDARLLGWMALVLGTCAANLVTTLVIVPPLAWFVLSRQPRSCRRPVPWLKLAIWAALPLLSYAYVYIRGAQHPEWRGQGEWSGTLAWFVDFISTRQGREEMTLAILPLDLSYLSLVVQELTWPVLVAGLTGLALLERRRAVLLLGTLALHLPLSYLTRTGNWYQVVMPAYPIVVLGTAALAGYCRRNLADRRGAVVGAVATVLLLLATAGRFAANLPLADLSARPDDDALCAGRIVLADLADLGRPEATVLVTYEEALSLQYLQTVLDEGAAARVLSDPDLEAEADLVSRHFAPLLPADSIWSTSDAAGRVLLERPRQEAPLAPPDAQLGPLSLALGSVAYRPAEAACGGGGLLVRVSWQAAERLDDGLVLSARALSGGQVVVAGGIPAQDDHPPLWGLVSPAAAGSTWTDTYFLPLPADVAFDSLGLVAYLANDPGRPLWETSLPLTIVP